MKKLSLTPLRHFQKRPGSLVLMIIDGIGIGKPYEGNAVHLAHTPNMDTLFQSPLYRGLKAHGHAVGMPSNEDMGNSEVGHNALGAGRVFAQGAALVDQAVKTGSLFQSSVWNKVLQNCLHHHSALHFIGLLSDGNVHSHIRHLLSMLDHAASQSVSKVRVHILLDGRDVAPRSALHYIRALEETLAAIRKNLGFDYRIGSGGGRMVITMDRYHADWAMVKRGWETHVLGIGRQFSQAEEAITTFYHENPDKTDQDLPAFVIAEKGNPIGTIEDSDSVIFFNFRGDRAIELSMAFEQKNFKHFDRVKYPKVHFAGMTLYDGDLGIPSQFLVPPPTIEHPISTFLCHTGIKSFAVSETQKYGHVTYFWNGNRSGYINKKLETYIEIPSSTLPFDEVPEMKAREITEQTIKLLQTGEYAFGRINFPNGDMVGHTGNLKAVIKSVETVDDCLGKLIAALSESGGIGIIVGDHGNAEEMITRHNGKPAIKTSHTLNPVPFVIVDPLYKGEYRLAKWESAGLANVAATICNLLGYEKPKEYAPSLIEFL